MPIGSVTPAVPPQVTTALAAIASNQAAEQAVAAQLEQAFQAASAPVSASLGQVIDLSV